MANFLISTGTVANMLGLFLLYFGLTMTVAVEGYGAQPVANMHLMQQQLIVCIGGMAAMIYGIVAIGTGAIVQRLDKKN